VRFLRLQIVYLCGLVVLHRDVGSLPERLDLSHTYFVCARAGADAIWPLPISLLCRLSRPWLRNINRDAERAANAPPCESGVGAGTGHAEMLNGCGAIVTSHLRTTPGFGAPSPQTSYMASQHRDTSLCSSALEVSHFLHHRAKRWRETAIGDAEGRAGRRADVVDAHAICDLDELEA